MWKKYHNEDVGRNADVCNHLESTSAQAMGIADVAAKDDVVSIFHRLPFYTSNVWIQRSSDLRCRCSNTIINEGTLVLLHKHVHKSIFAGCAAISTETIIF